MTASRSYGQFCPVAQASEILAERWTPLVLRELLCGSQRFNELRRGVPLMSPSLLSKRLDTLRSAGVITREDPEGGSPTYHLTDAGEALRPVIMKLGEWGHTWLQRTPTEDELDAGLLMWDVRRRIRTDSLPDERIVIAFSYPDAPSGEDRWWLVLTPDEVDLCLRDPGFEVDLHVCAPLLTMTRIWLGTLDWSEALASDELEVLGPTELRRQLPDWLELSVFA